MNKICLKLLLVHNNKKERQSMIYVHTIGKISLDFNDVKPCLDLLQLWLQLSTLGQGVSRIGVLE